MKKTKVKGEEKWEDARVSGNQYQNDIIWNIKNIKIILEIFFPRNYFLAGQLPSTLNKYTIQLLRTQDHGDRSSTECDYLFGRGSYGGGDSAQWPFNHHFVLCRLPYQASADNGSEVNVLYFRTFKDMHLPKTLIRPSLGPVVGFNGVKVRAMGVINLLVKVQHMQLDIEITIYDCPSSYHVIMGRGWIHKMLGVPSSYHQVIKCSIRGGIKIRGSQLEGRRCFALF